jgi:hypothetical protein
MYCEIWNARQELVQRTSTSSSCNYEQRIVTDVDEGNWTIVFAVNGKFSEVLFTQKVKVMKGKRNNLILFVDRSRYKRQKCDVRYRVPANKGKRKES